MTIKKYISRYIKLKLQFGELKPGDKLMSENELAIKFNCSRITARNAIQPLVYSGVIIAVKRVGYIVSKNYNDFHYQPIQNKYKIDNVELQSLKTIPESIMKKMNIKKNNIFFIKKYFKRGKLVIWQITSINKDQIWEVNYDGYKKSIAKELSMQGIIIDKVKSNISFFNDIFLDEPKKQINENNDVPIEEVTVYANNKWIEKTIRISSKNIFSIKFTKIIF